MLECNHDNRDTMYYMQTRHSVFATIIQYVLISNEKEAENILKVLENNRSELASQRYSWQIV